MSKRGGSELTHDNWDQEEEREDAGTFKKASEGDMKGRVIKRARRRNVGGEDTADKKNAFAGFGGFAAKTDTAAAFSFLSKSDDKEKPAAGGFAFGSASPKTSVAGGFSFGAASAGSVKPAFGAFSSEAKAEGGSSVFGSFTENKASSSPVSAPLFGSKSDLGPSNPTPKFGSKTDTASFGGFSFGAKDKVSEGDSVGSIGGKTEVTSESAKQTSESEIKSIPKPSFSSGFNFGNESSVSKTISSSSGLFSFGAASSKPSTPPPENVASDSGFTFKAQTTSEKNVSGSPFSFGSKGTENNSSASNSEAKASSGIFSFGSKSESTSSKTSNSSFSFGSKPESCSKPPVDAAFSFGKKSDSPNSAESGFSFGSKTDSTVQSTKSGFSFGPSVSEPSIPKPNFGTEVPFSSKTEDNPKSSSKLGDLTPLKSSATESKTEISTEYLAHLKALNLQVLAWLKQHIDANPFVILSPVFSDYDKHLADITEKFDGKDAGEVETDKSEILKEPKDTDSEKEKDKPIKLGLAAFGAPKTSASSAPFSFGVSSKPTNSASPFSFGSTTQTAPSGPIGGFSFGSGSTITASTESKADDKDEEDEDQPPVVEVKQVEESDAIYDKKCKLFYKKDGNYVEKGVGMLYLKTVEGGKTQLLVRADTNLGNVLLNILLSSQIPTTRVGKNNVMLVCVPNPPVDPKADSSAPCPMLIRVKTTEDADELKSKLEELKAKE